jgi:hypothetical protein
MADFPRYDGHLYIDAYQADIVKKITAGDDVTVTSGDLSLQDGKAQITFSATASTGLNINTSNPLSQPTLTLGAVNGITTFQTDTAGDTKLKTTGNLKLGFEASTPSNLSLYAGAGTDSFASEALQIRTTASTGTTFNNGTITFNNSSDDIDFIVNTSTIANAFKIDSGAFSAEFNAQLITKSDVFMETTNYTGLTTPGIRINHPGDSYQNRLLTTYMNDFSIESTSFTGITPALRLNYASDTLTIKVPTTFDGDVTHTSGTTIDFTGTTVIGLPTTGVTGLDGGVTWQNSGLGNPDLTVDDGTLTIRAWEWVHDGGDMEWKINPDSDPAYKFEVYSQNGLPDLQVSEGGVGRDGRVTIYAESFQFFPRPVGDGGTGGYVEYYISDGTKVMEWNLEDAAITANKGYRFDVKASVTGAGKFELNTTGQSDMDFVVNTSTISDTFYIDHGDDSLAFKGVLAEPWPTHRDTEANLALSLTEPGDIAYGNDADELVTRTNFTSGGGRNYNHYMNSTVQYTFAEDITAWDWGSLGFAFIAPAGLTPNSGSSLGGWVDQGFPETQPFRIVSARVNHEDGPDDATDYNSWRCIVSGDLGGSLKTVTSTAFRTEGLMPVLTQPIPFYKGLTYNILYESNDGYFDFVDPTDPTEWSGGVVLIGFRRFGSNYSTSTATPPGKTIAAVEIMTYRLI